MGMYDSRYGRGRDEGPMRLALCAVGTVFCAGITVLLLITLLRGSGVSAAKVNTEGVNLGIMDKFDMAISNSVSNALDGVLTLQKVYWLPDDSSAAPKPNPDRAGKTDDPAKMKDILEDARQRLFIEDMVFSEDTPILEGSEISYYLDDTIFSVTWKQTFDHCVYTLSEVKVGHPSQFRRFLSGGSYGSGVLYTASDMAESVNAVTAASGDYYSYRPGGTTVYGGEVVKVNGDNFDICFIDEQGDLIFSRAKELSGKESVEAFVKENKIKFSLCFGPVLVEDGQACQIGLYPVGEGDRHFSRAAIGQQGKLHYVLATANLERYYPETPTLQQFAQNLSNLGIKKAYALDGGQTATLIANNEVINTVSYGNERLISDIIYFATAIPDGD